MANKSSGPLERFLSLFAEVRTGEGVTALLLTLNLFLALTSYYIAKVVREPLILTGGGAELKSYLSAGQVILLLGAVRLYAWLSTRLPRKQLISSVTLFFTACLVLFYFLAQFQMPALGVVFFLWVGMFAVMVPAQCWSLANDVYTNEEGKRLFAIVAFGASSGAVVGSYLPSQLISVLGLYPMLLVAAGLLELSILTTNYVDRRERVRLETERPTLKEVQEEPLGKEGPFQLVFRNRYLLLIAFLVLLLNWVNITGGYILDRTVQETGERMLAEGTIPDFNLENFIGEFYAGFFTVVNLAGVLMQLFLVSRVLKYLGIRVAIMVLPIIAFGGYMALAFFPLLHIVRWAKTAENATDYSLNNTVRHALFLPTTREEKYKAKQAIDSFFHRSGDVLSAVVVFLGLHWFTFQTKHFALFNLALVAIWLVLAFLVGLENKNRTEKKSRAEELETASAA